MSFFSILQFEYVVAVFLIGFLSLIGFLTYSFGFQQTETKNDSDNLQKKPNKTKQKETKTKKTDKKPESSQPIAQTPTPVSTPVPVKTTKKVEEPVKATKKVEEPAKNVKKPELVKKQVKKEGKKEVQRVEEPAVQLGEETADNSGWTTVVDKRTLKKQKSSTPTSGTDNEESTSTTNGKNKKVKEVKEVKPTEKVEVIKNDQLVIGSKSPSELLTNSVIEKTETKEKEDDWIAANPKAKKEKKKEKKEVIEIVEVRPQVIPVVPEVKEVEKTKPKKAKKPTQQSVASAIQDAIVDNIETKKSKVNLKQTSLTDSVILIEKDNASKRTESNQSSNESLQDVDGDDGFITITNKKNKRSVRREQ